MCSSAEGSFGREPLRPERAIGIRPKRGALVVAVALSAASTALAQTQAQTPPPDLLRQHKCYFCHADNEAKAGPAFVDIAAAYKGNAQATSALVAAIRKGGNGSGPWHMPPHPEVSETEAKAMVRYILSLDP
jgi:cytochrome c